ncbi:MAG: FAD-dependent oxidoreductase [Clostridia bacterium]|nr:FAD-dependent oxidoreductase [Clostridia bacterium]
MILSEVRDGKLLQREVGGVEFEKHYDVIVSGVGTAGSVALILSAENGLSVLGIEAFNCVGGTTTIGGVQGPYFDTPGGRYLEIDRAAEEFRDRYALGNLEGRKYAFEALARERGAQLSYQSQVIGVYLEEKTVVGVRVLTPDGILNMACRVLMDCTGDAYVAVMAGCETEYGRGLDGLTQPYSMVSYQRDETMVYSTNVDFGRVDQRDDRSVSDALIFARAYEMAEDRGDKHFLYHMPLIGVREGTRILPEESVCLPDVFAGKFTEEPAFYAYADLDKHGWDIAFDGENLGDFAIGANLGAYNLVIPVPWKALIPRGYDGILVPCRGLGVDRDIASAVRMLTDMKKIGEVAADMALLSITHGIPLKDVSYDVLRERWVKSGCLQKPYDADYRIDGWRNYDGSPLKVRDVTFLTDREALREPLATLTPGEAIWSAKRMGDAAKPVLLECLASPDENTRKHASFALALLGDGSGIDLLRDMARERDGVMLQDSRKHNQQRGAMAIYFLGKLRDRESVDLLCEIITDPREVERPAYHQAFAMGTRYKIEGFLAEYFQFLTGATMALIRIGDSHPDLQGKIAGAFRDAFGDGSYYHRVTTRPRMSSEGGMVENIAAVAFAAVKRWNAEAAKN